MVFHEQNGAALEDTIQKRFKAIKYLIYFVFYGKCRTTFHCVYFLNVQLYVLTFRLLWLITIYSTFKLGQNFPPMREFKCIQDLRILPLNLVYAFESPNETSMS